MSANRYGILGGTFDPVHRAHIAIALQAVKQCELAKCLLIPNRIPPHRDTPHATPEQRVAMLQLAIKDHPELDIATCELDRDGPSYMIDTIRHCGEPTTKQSPNKSCHPGLDPGSRDPHHITLIIGADSFNSFDQWHQWQKILQQVQLAVFHRPHHPISNSAASDYITQHHLPPVQWINSEFDVSSTNIRAKLTQNGDFLADEVPEKVLQYIREHDLYRS